MKIFIKKLKLIFHPQLMSSSSDSESSDYAPIGFDPSHFRSNRTSKPTLFTQQTKDTTQLSYSILLKRAINILQAQAPSLKIKLPLEVKRENKKTTLNICSIANILNRDQNDLTAYVLSELLTHGNINQEGKLILKGSFSKSQVQDALKNYVNLYVVCFSCKKCGTEVVKESGVCFVKCGLCGSKRSISK